MPPVDFLEFVASEEVGTGQLITCRRLGVTLTTIHWCGAFHCPSQQVSTAKQQSCEKATSAALINPGTFQTPILVPRAQRWAVMRMQTLGQRDCPGC